MSVSDLSAHRARRQARQSQPTRAPDFTVYGWMEGGEVDWVSTDFAVDATRQERGAALVDCAWIVQRNSEHYAEQPAVWWLLDNPGSVLLWSKELYEGTTWRHAAWLVRQWWYLTKKLAPLAWRMARGR